MTGAYLLLLPFFTLDTHAKPCKKLVVDETDAFGVRQHGGVVYWDAGHYSALGLRLDGEQLLLDSMWVANGVVETVVPVGIRLELVLDDGSRVAGATTQPSEPVSNASGSTIFTQWKVTVPITLADLERLRNHQVVGVRTTIGEWTPTFEPPKKRAAEFRELAGCLSP